MMIKELMTEADDLAMMIVRLIGGDAEIEGTPERLEILRYVYQLPKYNHAARQRAWGRQCELSVTNLTMTSETGRKVIPERRMRFPA